LLTEQKISLYYGGTLSSRILPQIGSVSYQSVNAIIRFTLSKGVLHQQ